jgi:hypothetical protein
VLCVWSVIFTLRSVSATQFKPAGMDSETRQCIIELICNRWNLKKRREAERTCWEIEAPQQKNVTGKASQISELTLELLRNVMAPQSKQLATWYRKIHFHRLQISSNTARSHMVCICPICECRSGSAADPPFDSGSGDMDERFLSFSPVDCFDKSYSIISGWVPFPATFFGLNSSNSKFRTYKFNPTIRYM